MNTILLLGIGILGICCVPAKGLICHHCTDYRRGAGCVEDGMCAARKGQRCKLETLFMQDEPRQGCTKRIGECGTSYFDNEFGTATVKCCNKNMCNKV